LGLETCQRGKKAPTTLFSRALGGKRTWWRYSGELRIRMMRVVEERTGELSLYRGEG
jgi:hypothetical protein